MFDPNLSSTANVSIGTTTRITATACDQITTTEVLPTTTYPTSTTLPESSDCGAPLSGGSSSPYLTASPRGKVSAADALYVLRAAVGLESCDLCICDINGNGGIQSSDALLVLQLAVGFDIPLRCPPCL